MCIIVVPLNAAFGEANLQEDPLRMLEMATIRQNHPWLYYLHAAVVWLVCFTVHFFIDQALKKFLKFRMKWMEAVPIPQSTTVLVEAVPADWRSDGKLKMFFQKVFSSDDVVAAHLVKHEHDLAKLLAKRDSLLQLQRKAQQVFEKTQWILSDNAHVENEWRPCHIARNSCRVWTRIFSNFGTVMRKNV